jgi:hypothetical protein
MCASDKCHCHSGSTAGSAAAGIAAALLAVAGVVVAASFALRVITAILPFILATAALALASLSALLWLKLRQHGGAWIAQIHAPIPQRRVIAVQVPAALLAPARKAVEPPRAVTAQVISRRDHQVPVQKRRDGASSGR